MSREPVRSYWNQEVVLYRGEEVVAQGTIKEIAEAKGVLKATIRWYCTGAGNRRADKRKDQSKAVRGVLV